jgi:hypothetical protein
MYIQSKSSLDNSAKCNSSLHSLSSPPTDKAMLDKDFTCHSNKATSSCPVFSLTAQLWRRLRRIALCFVKAPTLVKQLSPGVFIMSRPPAEMCSRHIITHFAFAGAEKSCRTRLKRHWLSLKSSSQTRTLKPTARPSSWPPPRRHTGQALRPVRSPRLRSPNLRIASRANLTTPKRYPGPRVPRLRQPFLANRWPRPRRHHLAGITTRLRAIPMPKTRPSNGFQHPALGTDSVALLLHTFPRRRPTVSSRTSSMAPTTSKSLSLPDNCSATA